MANVADPWGCLDDTERERLLQRSIHAERAYAASADGLLAELATGFPEAPEAKRLRSCIAVKVWHSADLRTLTA